MDLMATNGSNCVNTADLASTSTFSYYNGSSFINGSVNTVESVANNGFYTPTSYVYMKITTNSAHGLTTGQSVTFSNCSVFKSL